MKRRGRARGLLGAALVAAAASLLPPPAAAQRWQVDASGTRVRFDTIPTLTSGSVAPSLEWQWAGVFAALNGSVTGFEGAQWATQGRGDLSLLLKPLGPLNVFRLEVVGMAGGSHHSSGFRTAATRGELRFHLAGRQLGAWAGAVSGTGWASGDGGLVGAAGATGGVWGQYGTTRAALTFTPLHMEGLWYPQLDARASMVGGAVEIAAYGGWRGAPADGEIDAAAWGGATASWWLTPHLALYAAGGSYASDLLQGLPEGRYFAGGLRVATRRPLVLSIKPLGRPIYQREDGAGLLRFVLPGAGRVDLAGDWNQWQPVPMERAGHGAWVLRVALPSGVYRFNLIRDGNEWMVPPGVASVDDGYGGRTGVFIVP